MTATLSRMYAVSAPNVTSVVNSSCCAVPVMPTTRESAAMSAAAAAERHTATDARILSKRLEEYRTAASGAPARYADGRLHLAIAAAAHTSTLSDVLLSLERKMHITAPAHPWGHSAGWADLESRSLQDHERLIGAILARDVAEAHEVGRRHARINLELLENARRRARDEPQR